MLISSLRQTSHDRITVCFEDGSELMSTLSAVTDMRIYQGKDMDDGDIEALRALSMRFIARDKAVELVSRRPMSCMELREKLIRKGITEDTADYCVDWLRERALISDESYSQSVARHYAGRGYGEGRVRSELSRRGISRELWDEALSSMPDTSEKIDKIIASKLKDPNDRDAVRKLSQSLYRRGFGWEEIRSALSRFNAVVEE